MREGEGKGAQGNLCEKERHEQDQHNCRNSLEAATRKEDSGSKEQGSRDTIVSCIQRESA